MTTILFIVGGFIVVMGVFVAVQLVANHQHFKRNDIYGASLMDVEDEERGLPEND